MKNMSNVLWGVVLVFIGLVLGLNALGLTNINLFFNGWWTLFIIVPCFVDIFSKENKTGSVIGFIIGVLLLLSANNLFDFGIVWRLIVPIALVIGGISLVFKNQFNQKIKKASKANPNEYCATFGWQNIDFNNEKFEGCNLTAVFGGVKCDLTEGKISEDVVVSASAIFGGVTIIVPDNVNVKVTSTPIFGGVENKYHPKKDAQVTIYVNATCLFGGVDIK